MSEQIIQNVHFNAYSPEQKLTFLQFLLNDSRKLSFSIYLFSLSISLIYYIVLATIQTLIGSKLVKKWSQDLKEPLKSDLVHPAVFLSMFDYLKHEDIVQKLVC